MKKASTGSEIAPRPAAPSGTETVLATASDIGVPVPLVEAFGPIVRQRWGGSGEIFHRLGRRPSSQAMGLGLGYGALIALGELLDLGFPLKGLGIAAVFAAAALPSALTSWRENRLFSRALRADRLDRTLAGMLVRIAGTVETGGEVFETPGTRRTVVYSQIQFWVAGARGRRSSIAREEIHGVPFRVRIAEGMSVRLQPEHIHLLDTPQDLGHVRAEVGRALGAAVRRPILGRSPRFQEAAIAPGDSIEAIGHLHVEVNVEGVAAPARGVPLIYTLGPVQDQGVLVRSQDRG